MFRSFLGRFREFMWNTPQSMKYLDSELFRNHLLSSAQYSNPLRLEKYGYKVYSQNDEDGIIAEIFQRIGTTNKTFVEFGVGDGLENNSHYLLLKGWNGLWIEGSKNACDNIKKEFSSIIGRGGATKHS